MNENFNLLPPGFIRECSDPVKLKRVAEEVFEDLKSRGIPNLSLDHLKLGAHYEYTDLRKCSDISLQPSGILAVFVDYDITSDTTYMVFRKSMVSQDTYAGFWPFPAMSAPVNLLSLYVAIYLTLEFTTQFSREWSLPAVLKKYPDVDLDDQCNMENFQRYGFEVLGFSPVVWHQPFNIFRYQHGEV